MAAKPQGEKRTCKQGKRFTGASATRAPTRSGPGNTLESFDAAVELGVDMIELDVLRDREGRLIVAHDFEDAAGAGRWISPRRSTPSSSRRSTRSRSTAT